MAITLPSGFKITTNEPVDNRMLLTKAEMAAMPAAKMPEYYICLCKDDGKLYIFDNSASANSNSAVGSFVPYEEVIDVSDAIQQAMSTTTGKQKMEAAISETLPGALASKMGTTEGATEISEAMFNQDHFIVDSNNKIDGKLATQSTPGFMSASDKTKLDHFYARDLAQEASDVLVLNCNI